VLRSTFAPLDLPKPPVWRDRFQLNFTEVLPRFLRIYPVSAQSVHSQILAVLHAHLNSGVNMHVLSCASFSGAAVTPGFRRKITSSSSPLPLLAPTCTTLRNSVHASTGPMASGISTADEACMRLLRFLRSPRSETLLSLKSCSLPPASEEAKEVSASWSLRAILRSAHAGLQHSVHTHLVIGADALPLLLKGNVQSSPGSSSQLLGGFMPAACCL